MMIQDRRSTEESGNAIQNIYLVHRYWAYLITKCVPRVSPYKFLVYHPKEASLYKLKGIAKLLNGLSNSTDPRLLHS